jgi:hypothetical protein
MIIMPTTKVGFFVSSWKVLLEAKRKFYRLPGKSANSVYEYYERPGSMDTHRNEVKLQILAKPVPSPARPMKGP